MKQLRITKMSLITLDSDNRQKASLETLPLHLNAVTVRQMNRQFLIIVTLGSKLKKL